MKWLKGFVTIMLMVIISNSYSQETPEEIELYSKGNRLNAKFYSTENKGISSHMVILLHGIPGNENSPFGLAEKLNKRGVNVLVFNYQGTFQSEGLFNYNNCWNDIDSALKFLKQKKNIEAFDIDTAEIVICGCSIGGSLALTAAIHNPEINKIISVVGGNDLAIYSQKMMADPLFRTAFENKLINSYYYPRGPVKGDSAYLHNYYDSILPHVDDYDLMKNADKFKNRQVLFVAAWMDTTIPMEEFIIPVYRKLKCINPSGVTIKVLDTDHSFKNSKEELADIIAGWIKKNHTSCNL